ncbi:GlxA family transcriptional regulator [Neptunomonas antarctica]|uniref:Transcriptional regulator, AraC family with amidase-like domain n=1 Tax=Neptunomonas antarctica TaxID=619304 RepID=A0A1N7L5T9_9GAMM|nr:GlxA family transcriptional regulator [Neptunomonas antarctica]SIS69235.1 transcriptional regulator, AraC family with amidase-like domain [Neptunomonas antarctica]
MHADSLVKTKAGALIADDDGVFTLSFLLLPEYAMVSLLSAIEPLRIANRLAGKVLFRWQCFSENGEAVLASNGMALQQSLNITMGISPRNLFVNASFNPEKYISETCIKWLRALHKQGCMIGALDTGCYLLAKAKLLEGYDMTLHWEAKPAFQERYPHLNVSSELFEIDRKRITCAGGTAATDMVLYLIEDYYQADLAILVCEQLIKSGTRSRSDNQRMGWSKRLNIHHPKILRALELMGANIENPLTASDLANALSISIRQLERLFLQHLKCSPSVYYLQIRIEHARYLLSDSGLSIAEIALASGFSSTAHFSRRYREFYGTTASQYRALIH